jgi:hypothetical protein
VGKAIGCAIGVEYVRRGDQNGRSSRWRAKLHEVEATGIIHGRDSQKQQLFLSMAKILAIMLATSWLGSKLAALKSRPSLSPERGVWAGL